MTDDRRYMSFEQRAAEGDERFIVDSRRITSKAAVEAAHREAGRIYIAMGECRAEARKHPHGSPEFDRAVAAFARHAERRSEIFARIRKFEEGRS